MEWKRESHTVAELCNMTKFTKKFAWKSVILTNGMRSVWLQTYYINWYYSGCDFCWKQGILDTFEGMKERRYTSEEFIRQYGNGEVSRFPRLVSWIKSIKLAVKTIKLKG